MKTQKIKNKRIVVAKKCMVDVKLPLIWGAKAAANY